MIGRAQITKHTIADYLAEKRGTDQPALSVSQIVAGLSGESEKESHIQRVRTLLDGLVKKKVVGVLPNHTGDGQGDLYYHSGKAIPAAEAA